MWYQHVIGKLHEDSGGVGTPCGAGNAAFSRKGAREGRMCRSAHEAQGEKADGACRLNCRGTAKRTNRKQASRRQRARERRASASKRPAKQPLGRRMSQKANDARAEDDTLRGDDAARPHKLANLDVVVELAAEKREVEQRKRAERVELLRVELWHGLPQVFAGRMPRL